MLFFDYHLRTKTKKQRGDVMSKINLKRDCKLNEELGGYYNSAGKRYIGVTALIKPWYKEFDALKVAKDLEERYGKPAEEYLEEWAFSAKEGERIHADINKAAQTGESAEINAYISYLGSRKAFTEQLVYDEESMVMGNIDLLTVGGGRVVITDWKTNKRLRFEGRGEKDRLKAPFDMFYDCNFNHYVLQLNCYRELVLRQIGRQAEMKIVHVKERGEGGYELQAYEVEHVDVSVIFDAARLEFGV